MRNLGRTITAAIITRAAYLAFKEMRDLKRAIAKEKIEIKAIEYARDLVIQKIRAGEYPIEKTLEAANSDFEFYKTAYMVEHHD